MRRDLGRCTDGEFAERYNVSPRAIVLKRESLAIPGCRERSNTVRWTAKLIRQLGVRLDRQIAHDLGVTTPTVSRKRRSLGILCVRRTKYKWSSPRLHRFLGTAPDAEIARQLGVCIRTIANRRNLAGILPFRYTSKHPCTISN